MEYRNPVFNSDGGIDCEINHPTYGWIPFTASPTDDVEMGRNLFKAIEAENNDPNSPVSVSAYVAPPKYPDLESARTAMVAFVDDFMKQITGAVPEYERASWPAKAEAARAYVAGTARQDQTDMIANEATTSGRTEAEVAAIIVQRADQYQEIIAHSAGLRVATDLALEAVTDPHDYETVLVDAKAQAIALAGNLGITVTP